jgi:programmed cell death 8 (apoptosis-inducing factor)
LNEQDNGGVAVVTGRRVTQVDAQKKRVRLDNSWEISFDKCLIATGGRPRNLPVFEKAEDLKNKVTLFRNVKFIKIGKKIL